MCPALRILYAGAPAGTYWYVHTHERAGGLCPMPHLAMDQGEMMLRVVLCYRCHPYWREEGRKHQAATHNMPNRRRCCWRYGASLTR